MKRYRSYKKDLIEKLKDSEYAATYLNACLEESFEAKDMGIFHLVSAIRACGLELEFHPAH